MQLCYEFGKMTGNNPNLDFVNINVYTEFGQILSISSKILSGKSSDITLLHTGKK